jgi:anaerobic magnesium-protoporphyrin IX monomethyl ester cyclase
MYSIDAVIVGGYSPYASYAENNDISGDKQFLLYRNNRFCDVPGLYKLFNDPQLNYSESKIDSPPLVCYVLKQLLYTQGHSSEMIFYLDFEQERMKKILNEKFTVILLSTTFLFSKYHLNSAAKAIRAIKPESIIIAGGPFVDRSWHIRKKIFEEKNPLYEPCSDDHLFIRNGAEDACGIDAFVIGDSNLSVIACIIDKIKKGALLKDIVQELPNCATIKDNAWHFSSNFISEQTIMPVIDWRLFRPDEIRMSVPMLRTKGCPNRCKFCNFHNISSFVEKPELTMQHEIESLVEKHGEKVKTIYFCDDNFCGNRLSMNNFCNMYINMDFPFNWITMFDARFIDEKLAELLKKTKCLLLKIGMESGDDRILKKMGKPCRVEHYRRAVSELCKVGISVDAFFIVGFPGETEETIKSAIDNLNSFSMPSNSSNQFILFPFMLLPLAPVFGPELRKKYGLSGHQQHWKHDTMDSETASSLLPQFIKQVTTFQPMHGIIEKIVTKNTSILTQIDKLRGDIIRSRLKNESENNLLWATLENHIRKLTVDFDNDHNLTGFL